MLSEKEIARKKKLASRVIKAIRKIDRHGLKILLRTNNTFGGVVYHQDNVPAPDTPFGRRTVLYLLTTDGKDAKEYAEFFNKASLESCLIFTFPDSPFLMTVRKAPTLSDDEGEFEWVILGARAENIANLKSDLIIKQETIDFLRWMIEQKDQTINTQKREILALRERIRDYEKELDELSRKVVDYETMLRRLETLLEKHMAGELEATAAVKEILTRAEMAGKWEVMGAKDRLIEILNKDKEIKERLELMYGGDGSAPADTIKKELESVVERKLRELLPEIVRGLQTAIPREEREEEAQV